MRVFMGSLVAIIGVMILFESLGYFTAPVVDYVVPLLVVALGLSFFARGKGEACLWCGCAKGACKGGHAS